MFIQLTFGVYDISLLAVGSRPCKAGENVFRVFRFSLLLLLLLLLLLYYFAKPVQHHAKDPKKNRQTRPDFNSTWKACANGTLLNEFFGVPYKVSVSWVIIQFLLHASNKPKSKDIKDRRLGKTSFP